MTTRPLDPAAIAALRQLVARFGVELVDEPSRVGALLRDVAGQYRLEISLLVSAAEEGVAAELSKPSSGPPAARADQLARRLEDRRGLSAENARWAVAAWGEALSAVTPPVPAPIPAPSPVAAPPDLPAWTATATTPPSASPAVPPASPAAPGPASPTPAPSDRGTRRLLVPLLIAGVVVIAVAAFALTRGGGSGADPNAVHPPVASTDPPTALTGQAVTRSPSESDVTLTWAAPVGAAPSGYVVTRDGVEVGTTTDLTITDDGAHWGSSPTYEVRATYAGGTSAPASVAVEVPFPGLRDAQLTGALKTTATITKEDGSGSSGDVGYHQVSTWAFTSTCPDPSCPVRLTDRQFHWTTTLQRRGSLYVGSVTGKFNSVCGSTPTLSHLAIAIRPTKAGPVRGDWGVTRFTGAVHETFADCSGWFDYALKGA